MFYVSQFFVQYVIIVIFNRPFLKKKKKKNIDWTNMEEFVGEWILLFDIWMWLQIDSVARTVRLN